MGRAKRWRVKRLSEKLLQIRVSMAFSQNELIEALNLKEVLYQSNISSYENGEREPPLPVILAYAKLAKVSTDILIDDRLDLGKRR
jgi:transcriptional regulator with XRE-family HTH domain